MKRALIIPLLALVFGAICVCGCKPKLSATDEQVLENARDIVSALVEYSRDNGRFPFELSDLPPYYIERMPLNPYTDSPTVDTKSDVFDSETSPGNVCYEKVLTKGEVLNFSLIVYGEKGVIKHMRHSPMAAN